MTGGLRLLILGESHYTMRKEEIGSTPPDYTMDVMQEGALVGKPYRLFRKVADLFACGTGDAQHWAFKAGTEAIAGLLDRLEPQVVVACGIRLWGYLAPHLDGFTNDPHGMDVHDDGRHVFGKFYHPSARAFCPQTWSARARALLDRGKDSRAKGRRWLWAELGA